MKRIITLLSIALLSSSLLIHPAQDNQQSSTDSKRKWAKRCAPSLVLSAAISGLIYLGLKNSTAVQSSLETQSSTQLATYTQIGIDGCNNCPNSMIFSLCQQPKDSYDALNTTLYNACPGTSGIDIVERDTTSYTSCKELTPLLQELNTTCGTRSGHSTQRFATPKQRFTKHKKKEPINHSVAQALLFLQKNKRP